MIYSNSKRVDNERMSMEILELKDRIMGYQQENISYRRSWESAVAAKEKQKINYENKIAERDAIIKELKNQLAHMAALAGHDGTNTGTSTAATPINKKKVVPNSRRSSGKTKGGQPEHKKHSLESFQDSEITDTVSHELDTDTESCKCCGGELIDTGETVDKDEFDVKIEVVKKRHKYNLYKCSTCGKVVRQPIENKYKEKNQYGSNVQALALSFMSTGNVAINKVQMLMNGMTNGAMHLSEGYISKLYKRASEGLTDFMAELRRVMITKSLLYWDDTVIMIQTKRACMRFYGDETISY